MTSLLHLSFKIDCVEDPSCPSLDQFARLSLDSNVRGWGRCITSPIFDEKQLFVVVLADLLHEHLEEVGGAHACPGPYLPIDCLGQLLRPLIEGED